MTEIRDRLTTLIASWPFTEAKAVVRVADILDAKPASYWSGGGRERVERELNEDGLSADKVDAVVLAVQGKPENFSLDRILADLVAREGLK